MSAAWPDGTPRSAGNAFDWKVKAQPVVRAKPMTRADINREQTRIRMAARAAAKKAAMRVNPESHISSPADAAKTAKLIGKSNSARSQ